MNNYVRSSLCAGAAAPSQDSFLEFENCSIWMLTDELLICGQR